MAVDERSLVPGALEFLDPAQLSYEEWLHVGMAMHAEGMSAAEWDAWSRRDPSRHHEGECYRKWASFGNSPAEVAGGTVVQMARDRGFVPERAPWDGPDEAIEWDSPIVDAAWVEPAELPGAERAWDPAGEAIRYLEALFDAEDYVGYVTSAWLDEDGRWKPKGRGSYSRTAGEIVADLRRTGSVEEALGTPNPMAGAWVRFNPLSGEGVRNVDVAEFRYALVESDAMELGLQKAMIDELELPCACVVSSGGKSLHAIVRVDAPDYAEYRRRVDYLYKVCERNGLAVDQQNKNPSRLSRFPGFTRNGRRQEIVSGPCGKTTWAEWVEWVEETTDNLPDFENLECVWDDLPPLAEPLIEGVLRKGHKMMVAAASKTGKTFLMIELAIAIAEGGEWLGFKCAQGKVLYINLELDRASCLHRFKSVYDALDVEPAHLKYIDIWNLRGHATNIKKLVPSLVRRALKSRPTAIILDPVYKVNMGDENSAEAVAEFCNQLDTIAEKTGSSLIYVHHHSKGMQGQKASIDRASGSGVFARDADAQIDMINLPLTDDIVKTIDSKKVSEACEEFMADNVPGWEESVDDDVKLAGGDALFAVCRDICSPMRLFEGLNKASVDARAKAKLMRGIRAELTLREFATPDPIDMWFDEPLHRLDSWGLLGDINPANPEGKNGKKEESQTVIAHRELVTTTRMVLESLEEEEKEATKDAVANRMGVVRAWSTSKSNQLKPLLVKPENIDKWVKAEWFPFHYEARVDEHGKTLASLVVPDKRVDTQGNRVST